MKRITERRIADAGFSAASFMALYFAGAGLWALLILPFGMWNFYDGMTRSKLAAIDAKESK